jgi:hypothetical protein
VDGRFKTVMVFPRRGNLYQIPMHKQEELEDQMELIQNRTNIENMPFAIPKSGSFWEKLFLLHVRCGHCDVHTLKEAVKRGRVKGVEDGVVSQVVQSCTVCQQAKSKQLPRPQAATSRATTPMERIHADTSGRQDESMSGFMYFSVLVDEATKWVDVRLLRSKDEVQNHVIDFKTYGENLHDTSMKVFRSDNALEYVAKKDFNDFLVQQCGVHMEQCTPYVHSQNGVAEKEIGMITQIANCLLIQSCLPRSFWAEAVMCAAVIRNIQPRKGLNFKTPFELWHSRVPDYSRLRSFGCLAFVHIPSEKRSKFESPSTRCIFTGYDNAKKAWRFMDLKTKKLIVSCDAVFNEYVFPYKVKNTADLLLEQLVPGGLPGLHDPEKSDIQQFTEYKIPLLSGRQRMEDQISDGRLSPEIKRSETKERKVISHHCGNTTSHIPSTDEEEGVRSEMLISPKMSDMRFVPMASKATHNSGMSKWMGDFKGGKRASKYRKAEDTTKDSNALVIS